MTAGPCGTPPIPINYLPHVIKLGTLIPGQLWSFNISFTLNACLSSSAVQGATLWGAAGGVSGTDFSSPITPAPLNYVVAAFQPGVVPTDKLNGAGQIANLNLPISIDTVKTPTASFQ